MGDISYPFFHSFIQLISKPLLSSRSGSRPILGMGLQKLRRFWSQCWAFREFFQPLVLQIGKLRPDPRHTESQWPGQDMTGSVIFSPAKREWL